MNEGSPKKPINFETVPIEVSINAIKREIEMLKNTIENWDIPLKPGLARPENKEFYESKLQRLEKELQDILDSGNQPN
jgi:sugar-specific transcriptional regulator TrmB